VYADSKLDAPISCDAGIASGQVALHLGRATHCIDHAGELDQEAGAGGLHQPAVVFSDFRVD